MKRLLLATALLFSASFGADGFDAEEKIAQIHQAPAHERRELMNAFKEGLATLDRKRREEALKDLGDRLGVPTAALLERVREERMARVLRQQIATQTVRTELNERMGQNNGVVQYIRTHPEIRPVPSGFTTQPAVPVSEATNTVSAMPFGVVR